MNNIKNIIEEANNQTLTETKRYINNLVGKRFENLNKLRNDIVSVTGMQINLCKAETLNEDADYHLDGEIVLGEQDFHEFTIFYLMPSNKSLYITEVSV